jgi:hypothetical protein
MWEVDQCKHCFGLGVKERLFMVVLEGVPFVRKTFFMIVQSWTRGSSGFLRTRFAF